MKIEAKSIEGFLPEKIDVYKMQHGPVISNTWKEEGFNQALDLLSKKKLEVVIDREKLAKTLFEADTRVNGVTWAEYCHEYWLPRADSVIASAKTDNGLVTIRSVE